MLLIYCTNPFLFPFSLIGLYWSRSKVRPGWQRKQDFEGHDCWDQSEETSRECGTGIGTRTQGGGLSIEHRTRHHISGAFCRHQKVGQLLWTLSWPIREPQGLQGWFTAVILLWRPYSMVLPREPSTRYHSRAIRGPSKKVSWPYGALRLADKAEGVCIGCESSNTCPISINAKKFYLIVSHCSEQLSLINFTNPPQSLCQRL